MAYLEIVIAGIAAFALGFLWYSALFGKAWQAETGITDEQAQSNMFMTHGLALLMMMIIAFGINYVVSMHDIAEQTFIHGGFHGLMTGVIYGMPVMAIHYLYQKKSLKLFLIDVGYILLIFALMGGVLGALKLG